MILGIPQMDGLSFRYAIWRMPRTVAIISAMAFIADDLCAWLVGMLADASRKKLVDLVMGSELERALAAVVTTAVEVTCRELCPDQAERAEHLALALNEQFSDLRPTAVLAGEATLLQSLRTGIAARMAPLDSASETGTGQSYLCLLGVSPDELKRNLVSNLVREIFRRAIKGGPLKPLADQLNHDGTRLQAQMLGLKVQTKLDYVSQLVETLAAQPRPIEHASEGVIARARRPAAEFWYQKILAEIEVDFWAADWNHLLRLVVEAPASVVLTARGGAGKSVLAAHLVRHVMQQDPLSCVMVLDRVDDLRGGIAGISGLLGADSVDGLMRYVDSMRTQGHRVLIVVDGLDAMTGAAGTRAIADVLRILADTSCLLVTCRTELWEQEFSHLSIQQQQVPLLSQDIVRRVLRANTRFTQWRLAVLQIPFYLNAALSLSNHLRELPSTETGLLQALWNAHRKPPGTAMPRWRSFDPVLRCLAELQLASMTYGVSRSELLGRLRATDDGADAVAFLEGGGIFWRQPAGADANVRLSHDLLDCFNMTRLLIDGEDAAQRRQQVYQRAAEGVGWPLLSMLVQVAYDGSDDRMLREVFGELVRMLDAKRWGDRWMGRSWAATYTLRGKIAVLMPLILECLDGRQVPAPAGPGVPGGSRIGPDACVTQEAASSLASSFDALDDWTAGRSTEAIPVLRRGLDRWTLRKRFVEALARYLHPAAAEALTSFAVTQVRDRQDLGVLGEVAEALGRVGEAFVGPQRQKCVDALSAIIACQGLDPRALRAAIEARNSLTYPRVDSVPEVDEAEIITNLSPYDKQRKSYSDWRVVEQYADYAYKRIMNKQVSQPLISALLGAFTHEQLFARIPVARCLGQTDDPAARAALLAEILRPSMSWDVQQACIDAMREQIQNAPDPSQRALRRWMVLDAAHHAMRTGPAAAKALAKLGEPQRPDDGLVTQSAFEVFPEQVTRGAPPSPSFDIVPAASVQVPGWIQGLVTPDDYGAVGPGWEKKYSVVRFNRSRSQLLVSLAETTWEEGASFHWAMRHDLSRLRENADQILGQWLAGVASMPSIFCIHSIVLTSDRKVVQTKRPADALYAANCWSLSFEEQVTAADLVSPTYDVATAAALRGFAEEFRLPPDGCRTRFVTAAIELPIMNPVLLAVIETRRSSDDFVSAAIGTQGEEQPEITEMAFVDAAPDVLAAEIQRTDLHPTSAIRALILSRLLTLS